MGLRWGVYSASSVEQPHVASTSLVFSIFCVSLPPTVKPTTTTVVHGHNRSNSYNFDRCIYYECTVQLEANVCVYAKQGILPGGSEEDKRGQASLQGFPRGTEAINQSTIIIINDEISPVFGGVANDYGRLHRKNEL